MRRAKIVCTLGPACDSPEQIAALIDAGMNVARLNLSHGGYDEHLMRLERVRAAAREAGRSVAVMVDLQGPKIRLGRFADGPHDLQRGDVFTITTEDVVGTRELVSTTYSGLPGDVRVGDHILIDDGKVTVEVTDVSGNRVTTTVIQPGEVSNNKGLNLPGVAVSVPALSEKDKDDLRWGLRQNVDLIALSFVRSAADLDDVKKIMEEEGVRVPVIAKIEKPQAVANLEEIVMAFDAIMVARGDLGVELPLEDVPLVQKRCIVLARENAKPVIVATQMLDSMIHNSRPTRAEASDCANAVLDGADALMLSGETSVGEFPIESVLTMARIIEKVEDEALAAVTPLRRAPRTKGGAITKAAAEVGAIVGAKYLCAFTSSGDSARRMSRLRSAIPLLAFTPHESTYRRLALSWGVEPLLVPNARHTDEMVMQVDKALLESGRARVGDLVMIVAGSPPGTSGSTNAMRVHGVGDAGTDLPAYRG
jgi:pyruvate kinase